MTQNKQGMASEADPLRRLNDIAKDRILILDGAMGTMIQKHQLQESDYRGARFADWPSDLKGNNDLLSLTKPEIIQGIHRDFLLAGADIIETNTFNANTISQADYDMQSLAREINVASARIARQAADEMTAQTPDKPRFVAGAVGPTNRTASISPDVNDPAHRNITYDQLVESYAEAVQALIEGGVDAILIETIFDTLNAKAAIYATEQVFEEMGVKLPIMISGTITDQSGRTLSGQTAEAFWYSVRHANPFSIGLNCAFGAALMRPFLAQIAKMADTYVSAYPNAGLPNEFGEYDELPEETGAQLREWADSGLLNIVGGCCGTTPDHIQSIAENVADKAPRTIPDIPVAMRLSGLEPFTVAS